MSRTIKTGLVMGCVALASASLAAAQDIKSLTKAGSFEDVKFELANAITERGLAVDYNGQLGKMLDRTGADVGSTKPIYKHAEFFTFCSAKLSRAMMEADPLNAAFCPYVVFIYEPAGAPGKITVGYRPPPKTGKPASDAALADIDQLLDGIIRAAVK
jgi:uncharacterized protein (DUF302 family)